MPRNSPTPRALATVLVLPLAGGALLGLGSPAYANGDVSAPLDRGSATALLGRGSNDAATPAYADPRSLVPGVGAPTISAWERDLRIRSGFELEPRTTSPSRSGVRDAVGPELGRIKVEDRRWARRDINLRVGPGKRFEVAGELDSREGFGITGLKSGDWLQVRRDGRSVWAHRDLVAKNRPPAPRTSARSAGSTRVAPSPSGVCSNGTAVSGSANVLAVHNAVCAAYPSIVSYGTYRADSAAHASGRAVDIMVSGSTGWAVAEYVRANAASLGVSEVIYAQKIWTVQRSGEGWRYMSDRGSSTANHYDHVHVTTY